MFAARALLPIGLAVALSACLVSFPDGTTVEDLTTVGNGGGGVGGRAPGGSGGSDSSSATSSAAHSSASATHAVSASASASSGGDGGAGDGGAGDGGAGDGGGDEGGAGTTSTATSSASTGMACDFTSPNQCANAESLGAIAGDEDAAAITFIGTTSKWYVIEIEERDLGIGGEALSWRVNLVSPPGMNYDVIVHEGPQDGDIDCNGVEYTGSADVTGETAYHGYDDEQGVGGENDTLWLAIEVRYISGEACTLSDTWTLSIQGHV